jgi:hypothetical protein
MKLAKAKALCSQVIDRGRFVQAMRPDGLEVFFDKADDGLSRWLNSVRAAGDRRSVILAVGLARGLQIAMNYAEQYGDSEDQANVRAQIDSLASNRLLSPFEIV